MSLGHFRWWPVLVLAASVATQTEVFFAALTIGLVIVSPVLGGVWSGWPSRPRWMIVGIGVGVVCWVAPVIQQFTGSFGNLAGLLTSGGREKELGLSAGFRTLAFIVWPRPVWLAHNSFRTLYELTKGSVATGVLIFVVITATAAVAWRVNRRELSALAAIGELVFRSHRSDLRRSTFPTFRQSAVPGPNGMDRWAAAFDRGGVGSL